MKERKWKKNVCLQEWKWECVFALNWNTGQKSKKVRESDMNREKRTTRAARVYFFSSFLFTLSLSLSLSLSLFIHNLGIKLSNSRMSSRWKRKLDDEEESKKLSTCSSSSYFLLSSFRPPPINFMMKEKKEKKRESCSPFSLIELQN